MRVPFVDLLSQYHGMKSEIDEAIKNVITETAFIGGKYVKEFEVNFSKTYGVKHCITVANGTDSIYIILKMLGIGQGDEVITSAYSWISSSEAISQTGATPVFVDIDDFFTINVAKIEEKITPKTKAILPVHIHGQMCDMEALNIIASKHNLLIIEDCAQSHFSSFKGTLAGKFNVAGSFSFYPGKNLGAYGDAGCIITNDDELAMKCRMYANHGALVKHQHKIEGINSRLDGLQASILSAKLPYILKWTQARRVAAGIYLDNLKDVVSIKLPVIRNASEHSFHLFVVLAERREELIAYLSGNQIETAIHYPTALPFLNCYDDRNFATSDFPVAFNNQSRLLSLPIFPEISKDQIEYVSSSIKEFYKSI